MNNSFSRRSVLGAAGVTGLGALVASCGNSKTASSSGSGSSASGSPAKQMASLAMFDYDSTTQAVLTNKVLSAFRASTGISTSLDTLPGSGAAIYPGKLRAELLGGRAPDVFRMWGGTIAEPFATSKQVVDLAPYYAKYGWDTSLSGPNITDMTYGGIKYGVPLYASALGIWYSKPLFSKAGVTVPTTYDEMEKVNSALVRAGVQPFLGGGKYGWDVMRFFEYFVETTAGPTEHAALLKGTQSWNTPAVVEAFALLKKWADQKWLPAGVMGLDPSQVETDFVGGKGAMTLDGQWLESALVTAKTPATDYGTFIPPTGHTPLRFSGFTEGLFITKESAHPDEAAELLNFFTKPQSQSTLQNAYTTVKAVPTAADYPGTAQWKGWLDQYQHYVVQDQSLSVLQSNAYFSIQSNVIQGQQTPAQAAAAMQKAISAASTAS